MKNYFLLIMAALGALALEIRYGTKVQAFANETHESGNVTRSAEAAIATRHSLVRKGTADDEVLIANATTEPLGVCTDEPLIDDVANVALLGRANGTLTMVASKAIAVGARVSATAGGKVTDAVVANAYMVGVALTAATAYGDSFEVSHAFPVKN